MHYLGLSHKTIEKKCKFGGEDKKNSSHKIVKMILLHKT